MIILHHNETGSKGNKWITWHPRVARRLLAPTLDGFEKGAIDNYQTFSDENSCYD